MALVRPLEDEDFDAKLLDFVRFFKGPLGVIPNSVRTMARRPEIARTFTNLNITVMKSEAGETPEFSRDHSSDRVIWIPQPLE